MDTPDRSDLRFNGCVAIALSFNVNNNYYVDVSPCLYRLHSKTANREDVCTPWTTVLCVELL